MDRPDTERLWAEVRSLLRAPAVPDDAELRRAARLLASSRSDALELLLVRWLRAQRAAGDCAAAVPPVAAGAAPVAAARSGFGLRETALVAGGLVGGALLGGLLEDE